MAVRVLGQDLRGPPRGPVPSRAAVQRVADDRDRRAVFRIGRRSAAARSDRARADRNVVFGRRRLPARSGRRSDCDWTTQVRSSPATTCAAVTTTPVPRTTAPRDRARKRCRGCARRSAQQRGRRGRRPRPVWAARRDRRAGDRRKRIDAREHVQEPLRRDDVVETGGPPSAERSAQRALVREQQRGRAEDPDEREPGGGATTSLPALSSARSGRNRSPERNIEPTIEPRASRTAARSPRRRARRAACTASATRPATERRHTRAEHCAGDDADDGQSARDEPLPQPDQAGQRDEPERDPVQAGHARSG